MSVSVEVLPGLERKINISVPASKITQEVNERLKKLARQVQIPGFRPGKVPMNMVKQKYYTAVYHEVIQSMIEPTFLDAIKEKDLKVAGSPKIDCDEIDFDKDFVYTAVIEVFPEFEIQELNKDPIELITSEVTAKDVEKMIDSLRKERTVWVDTKNKLQQGDKVNINFEGFINDEAFPGGKAENYDIVLGSGALIPGFEDALIGAKAGQNLDINVTFPEDYAQEELAGKAARFNITINEAQSGTLPELDAEFVKSFNIKDNDVDAFKKEIQTNMERELARKIRLLNRETVFEHIMKKNPIDLPNSLIDQEIENLKHDMYHKIFGHEHKDNEKIPDFPRELFEEQAKRRVHLGLIFSEYVKKHDIQVDPARVDAMIEDLIGSYEDAEAMRKFYQSHKQSMANIEAMVLEEITAEKILEDATVTTKASDYDKVVNSENN